MDFKNGNPFFVGVPQILCDSGVPQILIRFGIQPAERWKGVCG